MTNDPIPPTSTNKAPSAAAIAPGEVANAPAEAARDPASHPAPANPQPTLLAAPAADPAAAPAQAPDQIAAAEKAAARSNARTDAWTAAATPEGKKAAYEALSAEEKKGAYEKLSEADRKALGIEDPTLPVYGEFKFPEGFAPDTDAIGEATKIMREARMPPEAAQQLLDFAAKREMAQAQRGVQAFVELQNKWVSEIKADPEIGGDKLDASLASAARAIDRLDVPGLREALDLTGAGNNPAVVKAFVRLGQLVSEDRFQPGKGAPPPPHKTAAEVIYGGQPKQSADAE